ncbi:helix-turn-helix transcriptional regulator [Modestobacter marinus]|uniref:helix-turn-helix transcriptional regulator n=1 Tax=Modestobacter marinus TaxID=477641 RepID=UPI001C95C26A|nr:LuxR family transcriptional regulator [Modestobacter marinus]
MRLIDRRAEKQAVHELLDSVRAGMSRVLVLRGEPGVGKSALLEYAVASAAELRIVRTAAVESEQSLGFAAVHQLLLPLQGLMDRLPEPQRRALGVAFGSMSGGRIDPFLVGLAVLTLLSDAAEERPVLCVIDDAQWLDEESADILSFAARRLLADRVGMVFAIRETTEPSARLQALPSLRITGLPAPDAHELLKTSTGRPIDARVAERVVAETGGNPLAIVESARELTDDQLEGREPLPEPLPVGPLLDRLFVRRVRDLPDVTQTLLLLAAADRPGRGARLWEAAAALCIPGSAAAPAEAAGLVTFWPDVRFTRPLVRSAVYHAATPAQRRQAHRVLAEACDPDLDADARAWHLSAAAAGPDERAAAELQTAAERAGNRGGYAAAAMLLERAAVLTPGRQRRAGRRLAAADAHLLAGALEPARSMLAEARPGLQDTWYTAQATRLQGEIEFATGYVFESASALVDAAERLRPLDPTAARDALLSALEAAVFAGWARNTTLLHGITRTARGLLSTADPPDSAANLLLQGCTARVTEGYAKAVPMLQQAVQAFQAEDVDPDAALRRLMLAAIIASDLLDDSSVERLTTDWINQARGRGALTKLAAALAFRSAVVDGPAGRLAAARAAEDEAHELAVATHNPGIVPPTGAHTLLTLAMSGSEAETRATAAAVALEAPARGAAGEMAMAAYFTGVLEISLGNYGPAVACLEPAYIDDTPLVGTQALPDLVEAAVRADQRDLAERALERLEERATATGTALALGLLARSRALLAAPGEAREQYLEGLDLISRTSLAPQLARTHLLFGEWLRRQRQRREAREQLRTAHDMFDRMGLAAFAERAGAELRATGERAQRREPGAPEKLTPQEAHIAALVSRGDANRDIAAQLFISPSTVEYHLRKVFRKLGVTSRTQLARRIVDDAAGVHGAFAVSGR